MSVGVIIMVDSQPKSNPPGPHQLNKNELSPQDSDYELISASNVEEEMDTSMEEPPSAVFQQNLRSDFHSSSRSRKMSVGVMADPQPKSNPGPSQLNKNELSPQDSEDELISCRNVEEEMDKRMEKPPSAVFQQKVASHSEEKDGPEKDKHGSTDVLRSKLLGVLLGKANEDANSETPEAVKRNYNYKGTDTERPAAARRRPVTRSWSQKRANTEEVNSNIFTTEEGLRGRNGSAIKKVQCPKKDEADGIVKETSKPKHTSDSSATGFARRRPVTRSLSKKRADATDSDSPEVATRSRSHKRAKTDSESAEVARRRPVTRSLSKKRATLDCEVATRSLSKKRATTDSAEVARRSPVVTRSWSMKRAKTGGNLGAKSTEEVNNKSVFTSEEGLRGENGTVRKKNTVVKVSKVQFREKDEADGILKEKSKSRTPALSESTRTGTRSSLLEKKEVPLILALGKKIFIHRLRQLRQRCSMDHLKMAMNRKGQYFLERKGDYSFPRENSAEPDEDLVLSSDEKDSDEDSPALDNYNSPQVRETANERSKPGFGSAKETRVLPRLPYRVLPRLWRKGSIKLIPSSGFQRWMKMKACEGLLLDLINITAVTLFAMAFRNFEKMLKSAAEEKTSDIIPSVSEAIHLELKSVKSHITIEAEKTRNVAKTKREHAEKRLKELQHRMRMIHEKFKEDVAHYLEDVESTIQGLEANHSELKGSIKKQRESHQKLIANFEEGIETKLQNGNKSIHSVNESARGKMLQLMRTIVAQSLNDH
ncbi:Uncharacterized protein Rs2_29063 [Raphanus sativus]|nr:Uncharacterized protein Rs2_29063 [Raphanus sativus]